MVDNLNIESIDELLLHKMIFIYNAVENGWNVSKNIDNNFEFKINKDCVVKKMSLNDNEFLKNFIKKNLILTP